VQGVDAPDFARARRLVEEASRGVDLLARGTWPLLVALVLLLFSASLAALAEFNPLRPPGPAAAAAHPALAAASSLLLGLSSASAVYGLSSWASAARSLERVCGRARLGLYAAWVLEAGFGGLAVGMLAYAAALHAGPAALAAARLVLVAGASLVALGWVLESAFFLWVLPSVEVGGARFPRAYRVSGLVLASLGPLAGSGVAAGPSTGLGMALLAAAALAGVAFTLALLAAVNETKRRLSRIAEWGGAPPPEI